MRARIYRVNVTLNRQELDTLDVLRKKLSRPQFIRKLLELAKCQK